jgi:hypothetical protein
MPLLGKIFQLWVLNQDEQPGIKPNILHAQTLKPWETPLDTEIVIGKVEKAEMFKISKYI